MSRSYEDRCGAVLGSTYDGLACTSFASRQRTINGALVPLCGNHALMFDEHSRTEGVKMAALRVLEGTEAVYRARREL